MTEANNHFPGADGLVGTGDDPVSSYVSPVLGSDANFRGSFSFVTGAMPTAPADPSYFPPTHNGASFSEGTITIDPAVAISGGGPLILDWNLVGTAPIQGQGASFLEMISVNTGTYDPVSGAMTLDFSPQLTTGGEVFSEPSLVSNGTARVLQAPFPSTGDPYIDSVLVPLAQGLGADGLFFAQMNTTVPGIITIETSLVLVALRNVAAATDVTLSTTINPATGAIPGSSVDITLSATNNGPIDATNARVSLFMPLGLTWGSGTCGGPPVGDELTWTIGPLPSGTTDQCTLSATIDATTPFDLEFGASFFMDQVDTQPDDNVIPLLIEVVAPGTEGVNQPVASNPLLFPADANCDNCSTGMQTLGGNFKVNDQFTLENVGFFGVYSDNNAFTDLFVFEVRGDTGKGLGPRSPGVPGALVQALSGTPQRTATGNLLYGAFNEYRYSLATSLALQRGKYWLTLFNDSSSSGGTGDWIWVSGAGDNQGRSLASMSASAAAPPTVRWSVNPDPGVHLAFDLSGSQGETQMAAIPTLSPLMAAGLSMMIGLIGVAVLQRGIS